MDETEVADALFEELDAWHTDHVNSPLAGFRVTRDETGIELQAPSGDRFRAIVVQVG